MSLKVLMVMIFISSALAGAPRAEDSKGKVIAVYRDGGAAKLVIEAVEPLVAGREIYVGPGKIPATLGELLSRSEHLYYYNASAEGKGGIEKGDAISLEAPKPESGASAVAFSINEHFAFEQKRLATVTAVQGDHAMVNRGSLHEVRERDIYRIYDSSDHYKGLIELRGIGDLQSSGKLYNALEDFRRDVLTTSVGDKAVFAGQRKLFALGMVGGLRAGGENVYGKLETNWLGGLLWDVTFPDGWGAEILFGAAYRFVDAKSFTGNWTGILFDFLNVQEKHYATFIAPVWLKKNFFYPSVVSPFLAAGLSIVDAEHMYVYQTPSVNLSEDKRVTTVAPVLGGGVEFFPGHFFRPRFEVRWFDGPKVTAAGNAFNTETVYYSVGFLTTW